MEFPFVTGPEAVRVAGFDPSTCRGTQRIDLTANPMTEGPFEREAALPRIDP